MVSTIKPKNCITSGYQVKLRAQMLKILELTEPSDWLFKDIYHFDGQVDGIEYGKRTWEPVTEQTIEWIKERCLEKRDRVEFITGSRDQFGNTLEPMTFELWNVATHHYELKPG